MSEGAIVSCGADAGAGVQGPIVPTPSVGLMQIGQS